MRNDRTGMKGGPHQSVYVSYAWKPPSQAIVDRLQATCAARGIELRRDLDRLKYGESIRKYMQELGQGGAVVVVLSPDYLESENCMYELLEIEKNKGFHERVYPVVLRGTPLYDPAHRVDYAEFWERRAEALEQRLKALKQQDHLSGAHAALDLYRDIRRSIDGLMRILADMNALTEDVHVATDFDALIDRLLGYLGPPISAGPQGQRMPLPPDDTFEPALAKSIDEQLQPTALAPLRRCLAERLGSSSETGLGQALCAQGAMSALGAFRGAAHACRGGMADEDWAGPLQTAARRILGWLLARLVRAERPADPFAVEVRVGTEVGAEVLWVRWLGGGQPPEFKVVGKRLIGKSNVLSGAKLAEAGWERWRTYVHDAKLALWDEVLYFRTPPSEFGPAENQEIRDALDFNRSTIGDSHYVTVNRAWVHEPLDDPEVLEALRQDIGLPILFIEASDEQLFEIPEWKLRNNIAQCVDTIEGRRP